MRDFLSHLWKQTALVFNIHILWIRGHSKDIGNDLADRHAGEAADEDNENEVRWRPNDWRFSEFRKDYPAHFAAGKTTAMLIFGGAGTRVAEPIRPHRHNENKRKNNKEEKRLAESQGRIEDQERNLKPNILEIQKAIADAAALCGRPDKRFLTKLARDHPAVSDLTEARALRSMAPHPLARFALNKRVTKCRAKARAVLKISPG